MKKRIAVLVACLIMSPVFAFAMSVVDDGGNGTGGNNNYDAPPAVKITAPRDNVNVSGTIDIMGSVQDDNLKSYTVAVIDSGGEDLKSETVTGSNSFTRQSLMVFDTSGRDDGVYYIVLSAEDTADQVESTSIMFNIANASFEEDLCKDGDFFTLGFDNQGQCVSYYMADDNAGKIFPLP